MAERSLKDYRHTVSAANIARVPPPDPLFSQWLDGLPNILAGGEIREVIDRWITARRAGRPVIWAFGAHVVKVGLGPWLNALMEAKLITRLAVNGAVVIHDFELAAVGHTSEDVGEALETGVFGQAEETARFFNTAAGEAAAREIGLGQALTEAVLAADLPHADLSVLASAGRCSVPLTVHLALGTDTVHAHPSADGAALGKSTLADFNELAEVVADLDGGVFFNVGSAVILPEVFLKAVSRARARGRELSSLTTVVLDFLRHYRPQQNVCRRPVGRGGRGYYLVGHHEVLVPLLAQAALDRWRSER